VTVDPVVEGFDELPHATETATPRRRSKEGVDRMGVV
jgi:hypothetical protein